MDEDNEIFKLRKHCQYLEEYLQQEISKQDSSKNIEILNVLIREKSAEILNLEKALGGYTAEIDIQVNKGILFFPFFCFVCVCVCLCFGGIVTNRNPHDMLGHSL